MKKTLGFTISYLIISGTAFAELPALNEQPGNDNYAVSTNEYSEKEETPRGTDAAELFEKSDPFFSSDSATSVFAPQVELTSGVSLGTFREDAINRRKKREEEKRLLQKETYRIDPRTGEPSKPEETDLSTPEKIIKIFGDPSKESPVLAQPNAPKPFQAMMAALHAGDEELAWKYARQYARYMKNVEQREDRVVGLTGLAMEGEGLLPKDGWQKDPKYNADRRFLKEDQKAFKKEDRGTVESSVSEKARKMIEAAAEEEEKPISKKESEVSALSPREKLEQRAFYGSPQEQVELARQDMRNMPVDPQGKADVYFFMSTQSPDSLRMAGEMQKVFESLREDSNGRFYAVTIDNADAQTIALFEKVTGSTFPKVPNAELGKEMNIVSVPTVVIAAHSTGKAIQERGLRGSAYILEKVRIVKGGR